MAFSVIWYQNRKLVTVAKVISTTKNINISNNIFLEWQLNNIDFWKLTTEEKNADKIQT